MGETGGGRVLVARRTVALLVEGNPDLKLRLIHQLVERLLGPSGSTIIERSALADAEALRGAVPSPDLMILAAPLEASVCEAAAAVRQREGLDGLARIGIVAFGDSRSGCAAGTRYADVDAWVAFPECPGDVDHALGPFLLDPALAARMHERRQRARAGIREAVPTVIGLVDDQELNRRLLRMVLARSLGADNVRFVEGMSGPDAVGMRFGEQPPDLIILNGAMPGGDGPAAIAEIRRQEASSGVPQMPLVIESGAPTYLRDGLEAGANASFSLSANNADVCAIVLRLIS